MRLMSKTVTAIEVSLLCLFLTFFLSCESSHKYAGTYEAKDMAGEVVLELKAGGEGNWISGFQEVAFSWHLKGGELRINTREGGVIVGKIRGDTIEINIPGQKEMVFRKAPQG
jgi:hypothetical protein